MLLNKCIYTLFNFQSEFLKDVQNIHQKNLIFTDCLHFLKKQITEIVLAFSNTRQ